MAKVIFKKNWPPYSKGDVETFPDVFLENNQMYTRGLVENVGEKKVDEASQAKEVKAPPKNKQVKAAAKTK